MRTRRILRALGTLAVVALVALVLQPAGPTEASNGGPEMRLNVHGADCNYPLRPTRCVLATGASFTLSVNALGLPANGYGVMQSWVDYGNDLTYNKTTSVADEIAWPDCALQIALRYQYTLDGSNHVNHGCLTAVYPAPLVQSLYTGRLIDLDFTCSPEPTSTNVKLVPAGSLPAGTSGAFYLEFNGGSVVPKVGNLRIDCIDPAIDTDNDGCKDLKELGFDETKGGLRDPTNPWDFYDVSGGGIVDLANDILGVILHYAPQGQPPYHPNWDRGEDKPPYVWNLNGPDGVIDLVNDILGVIRQYLHDCR